MENHKTKSQNQEGVRVGGTTEGHLGQTQCSSRVIPEHMAQGCVFQTVPEYLQ